MPRSADRVVVRVCLAAAIVWALALPLSAYGAGRQAATRGVLLGAAVVYGVGAVICHQRPERSFSSWGVSWPVCARCTGIYMGAAGAALVGLLQRRRRRSPRPAAVGPALAAAMLPSLATLIFEWTTGATPGNVTRLLAGLPIGVAVIAAIALGARPDSA